MTTGLEGACCFPMKVIEKFQPQGIITSYRERKKRKRKKVKKPHHFLGRFPVNSNMCLIYTAC